MSQGYVDIDRPTFGISDAEGTDGGSGAGLLVDLLGWVSDKVYGLVRSETWLVSVFDPTAEGNGVVAARRVDGSEAAWSTADRLAAEHGEPGAPLEIRAHRSLSR